MITGNDQIIGGPGDGSLGDHYGIRIAFADAVVSDNALISGNPDFDNPIRRRTYGIYLRDGELIAENNELILGGHSSSQSVGESEAIGIYEQSPNPSGRADLRHNDIVTGGDCLVEQDDNPVCATTAAEVNALDGNGFLFASGNVSLDPMWQAPMPFDPDAAGYHLDGSCALEDLGQVSALVSEDYDGELRDNGIGGLPEIGPDECP